MDTKESPVKLIYKAAIKQNTGESWDNVPLQLETSTPTFGLGVPKLSPWNVDIYQPPSGPTPARVRAVAVTDQTRPSWRTPPSWHTPIPGQIEDFRDESRSRSPPHASYFSADEEEDMGHEEAAVTSSGNVNATFRVPGLVTIPCGRRRTQFHHRGATPKATMSWVAVPKGEARAHLTAYITNASDYTLLSGTANVYVDRSFIARSVVPRVSSQESFSLPSRLGPLYPNHLPSHNQEALAVRLL
ncbi:hypothetical protein B0H14DRAFT_911486 [Mycena olivaceomarginata]|nr:hypothetical protein B0H14DRAFT_911486 [Mycena olivaceomarginata]